MRRRIDVRIYLQNPSLFVDHIGDAFVESEDGNSVCRTVVRGDLAIRIEQQRKRQIVLLDELTMRFRTVDAASKHGQTRSLELREAIAESSCLFGASGGVVLRIEIQDNFLAAILGKRERC